MSDKVLKFNRAVVTGIVTVVGDKKVSFLDNYSDYGLNDVSAKRLAKTLGLETRYIVSGETTTSDLCLEAASKLINGIGVLVSNIDALIFVSQSPDFSSPATAISLQHRLGMSKATACFDIRLGCSGFVYGLATASAYIEAGYNNILLCVGDVASKLVSQDDHTIAPLMGDAGSAILVTKGNESSNFCLYSDGSGYDSLIIPNSGVRNEVRYSGAPAKLQMNGAEVFNFTLKNIPDLVDKTIAESGIAVQDIDHFIFHQPNKYILKNILKKMQIDEDKVPCNTQSIYGNQNSASIPGTINGFLGSSFEEGRKTTFLGGFGVGLSWGGAIIRTNKIFAPKSYIYGE
jgi:3-oxoacyl-[acyl-carrier-protein] synthase-3